MMVAGFMIKDSFQQNIKWEVSRNTNAAYKKGIKARNSKLYSNN
jgi:hypothetical protein